jgi:hypothetical protein
MVSVPAIIDGSLGHGLGFSNTFPGGFAQRMLLSADIALRLPNGLHHGLAALTEPASVGEHAVDRTWRPMKKYASSWNASWTSHRLRRCSIEVASCGSILTALAEGAIRDVLAEESRVS